MPNSPYSNSSNPTGAQVFLGSVGVNFASLLRMLNLGDAAGKNVGTGADNVAAGVHTHTMADLPEAARALRSVLAFPGRILIHPQYPAPAAPTVAAVQLSGGGMVSELPYYRVAWFTAAGVSKASPPTTPVVQTGGTNGLRLALPTPPVTGAGLFIYRYCAGAYHVRAYLSQPGTSFEDGWSDAYFAGTPDFSSVPSTEMLDAGTGAAFYYCDDPDAPAYSSIYAVAQAGSLVLHPAVTLTNSLKIPNEAGEGKVLTSDSEGNASWQTAAGGIMGGAGSPETAVTAIGPMIYIQTKLTTDGNAGVWIKPAGSTGNSGWQEIVAAA